MCTRQYTQILFANGLLLHKRLQRATWLIKCPYSLNISNSTYERKRLQAKFDNNRTNVVAKVMRFTNFEMFGRLEYFCIFVLCILNIDEQNHYDNNIYICSLLVNFSTLLLLLLSLLSIAFPWLSSTFKVFFYDTKHNVHSYLH